jgi:protein transport protein SEC24
VVTVHPLKLCNFRTMFFVTENGIHLFLWIGLNVSMEWVQKVFGVHSAAQIDIDRTSLPHLDSPLSARIHSVIASVRHQRHRYMRVNVQFFFCYSPVS